MKSSAGILLKLNRKKNASVNEKAQIIKSIIKIDHLGKLYFQKKLSNLDISGKVNYFFWAVLVGLGVAVGVPVPFGLSGVCIGGFNLTGAGLNGLSEATISQ